MQAVKRAFEWYLGLSPVAPGQGTAWRIETRSVGPEGWPTWLALLAAILVVVGIVMLYLREAERLPRRRRLILAGLRLAAAGLIAVMLSQATLAVDRTGLPVIAVLIDDSASMSLPEAGSSTSTTAGRTRLDLARAALLGERERFLRSLSRRFRVRLYRFDGEATPLAGAEDTDLAESIRSVRELTPDGAATRPAAAVRGVLDDLRGAAPSAIVVFSDGISTAGEAEALSAVAPLAGRRRVPLYPVGIGSDGPARDLELHDVVADEVAFLGDPVRITARFRTFGLRGVPVTLTLTDQATGRSLATSTAEAAPDGRSTQIELTFSPEAEGEFDVTLTARAGAEANRANNAATRHVSVRDQKVRVLLADHAPRYEFRFLKAMLEREPTVELDTVLQEADLGFSAADRTALERFPLRKEEILAYDVILFGDLDPSLLGADVLSSVAQFIGEKGGGFVGIAGSEFFPARYVGTPLEPLLPVAPTAVSIPPADTVFGEPFRLRPTLAGHEAGLMVRPAESTANDPSIWDRLPGLYWRAEASSLSPGAIVLAEAVTEYGTPSPVVLMQRFGAGKVLLHLTDETWRWRYRVGDEFFGRYWIQTVRFLSRSALLGRDRGAELISDRRSYAPGEPVALRLRFINERLIPEPSSAVNVVVEDRAGGRREVELARSQDAADSFEGRIDRLPEGAYHAWVREPAFTGVPPAVDFRIEAPERELMRRGTDFDDLRRAAEVSGGRFFKLDDVDRLPARLPAGRPVRMETSAPRPLWNRPELLLTLAIVLTGEWVLRKRSRLP